MSLSLTRTGTGAAEVNEPVLVYDTSGPWGDPSVSVDVYDGLPALRRQWIVDRDDVVEYDGRQIKPIDDGYNTAEARDLARGKRNGKFESFPGLRRRPLKAKSGGAVTQLGYARRGIVTPEMEFIALRENMGREQAFASSADRSALSFQHKGESFGASLPGFVTPEFVRDEVARGRAIIPRISTIRKASR